MSRTYGQRVYALVRRGPPGSVATYGQIAALLGNPRAARAVAAALRNAPNGGRIPCHRIVNRRGSMAPADVFGPGVQSALLRGEGVVFLPDGSVDMRRCLWQPQPSDLPAQP
ncbi:MAG: methylated-DNA--[protein]-cysteine S-methyltransferase [Eubacteriales bacterium]|nr:methylated-DNA--[protein]-cysteine S-methyltransferase [Eubacteriales bacterium]